MRLQKWHWKNIPEPVRFVQSWKNTCWTSCMKSQKMIISEKLSLQKNILNTLADQELFQEVRPYYSLNTNKHSPLQVRRARNGG